MRSGGALLVLASLAATGSALLESRSLALAPSVCAFTGRASSEDCRSCIGKGPCGYCADDDSCREGSLLGAQWGGACASWNYETCAAVPSCHEKTDCAGCAASPRCGWCASSDAYKTGCFPFDRDDAPRAGESLGSKVSFHAPNKCAGGPWVQRDLFAGGADEVADTCSGRPTRSEAIEAYEAKLLREKNNPSLGGARAAVGSGRAGNAGTESVSGSGSGSGSGSETVAETRYASSTVQLNGVKRADVGPAFLSAFKKSILPHLGKDVAADQVEVLLGEDQPTEPAAQQQQQQQQQPGASVALRRRRLLRLEGQQRGDAEEGAQLVVKVRQDTAAGSADAVGALTGFKAAIKSNSTAFVHELNDALVAEGVAGAKVGDLVLSEVKTESVEQHTEATTKESKREAARAAVDATAAVAAVAAAKTKANATASAVAAEDASAREAEGKAREAEAKLFAPAVNSSAPGGGNSTLAAEEANATAVAIVSAAQAANKTSMLRASEAESATQNARMKSLEDALGKADTDKASGENKVRATAANRAPLLKEQRFWPVGCVAHPSPHAA